MDFEQTLAPSDSSPAFEAWQALSFYTSGARSVLDVGCNVGDLLEALRHLGASRLYGIDINPAATEAAKVRFRDQPQVEIRQGSADELYLQDGSVDISFCLEVLEHIPREMRPKVIQEVHRVTKPGGLFVLSVPHNGAFSFLDPANARLRFPWAFGHASRLMGGRGREHGYEGQKHGLIWHHHFERKELIGLVGPWFEIREVRWRGAAITPLCHWLQWPFYRKAAPDNLIMRALRRVERMDMSVQWGERLAYDVCMVGVRREVGR